MLPTQLCLTWSNNLYKAYNTLRLSFYQAAICQNQWWPSSDTYGTHGRNEQVNLAPYVACQCELMVTVYFLPEGKHREKHDSVFNAFHPLQRPLYFFSKSWQSFNFWSSSPFHYLHWCNTLLRVRIIADIRSIMYTCGWKIANENVHHFKQYHINDIRNVQILVWCIFTAQQDSRQTGHIVLTYWDLVRHTFVGERGQCWFG